MTKWCNKQINELGRVVTGKTPPKNETHYFDGDELFVSPKDLGWDCLYVTQTETRVSSKALSKFRNQVIPKNAVMFTSLSFGFGKMGIASRLSLSNQQINSVIVNEQNDSYFVYYLLKACTPYIFAYNSGIDTPIVPKSVFERIRLKCPELQVQRKIAALLWAYDQLIENNKRRIALLEKLAEEIYREWFVRLRFPGYEKAATIKGVPTGWDVLPFSKVVSINPPERLEKSEDTPYVGMEDLSVKSLFFRSEGVRKGGPGSKFRNRDVLFPRITPSVENGKRGFVMSLQEGQVGLGSTEFIVFREKVITAEHVYFLTCSPDFRKHAELSMTGASGRQRVQEDCFSFFLVKTPPPDIRRRFSNLVQPHFSEIHFLSEQIDKLMISRDLLLPRLISGKLSVENLDIQFPPGMMEELNQSSNLTHDA